MVVLVNVVESSTSEDERLLVFLDAHFDCVLDALDVLHDPMVVIGDLREDSWAFFASDHEFWLGVLITTLIKLVNELSAIPALAHIDRPVHLLGGQRQQPPSERGLLAHLVVVEDWLGADERVLDRSPLFVTSTHLLVLRGQIEMGNDRRREPTPGPRLNYCRLLGLGDRALFHVKE